VPPAPARLPRYLDLGFYAQQDGIPFTFSSNLLHALHAAVKHVDWEKRFAGLVELSTSLRTKLLELGFPLVGSDTRTSPAVVTLALPPEMDSTKIGGLMQEAGYLLSCHSGYLRQRNWIQICLMGECTHEKVVSVVNALNRVCFKRRIPETAPVDETETIPAPR
jgi:aspartate aminotransferase-like enzyme